MTNMIDDLKIFLIDILSLEDIEPEDIDPKAPLFNEGLGLDSIDALEIGVGLQKRYNIKMDSKSDETFKAFESLESLARYVEKHQKETTGGNL